MSEQIVRNIRQLCNHPWKRAILFKDEIIWNKLWTSLDIIDDAQMAIDHYQKLPDFSAGTGGYLFIFGLLQGLNLQQDAANSLHNSLLKTTIDFSENYPELYKIREYRNNSIGHPTNRRNDKSFHLINQSSIAKSGFELASFYPKTGDNSKFEPIDISNCIKEQSKALKEILTDIMEKLENDFNIHKERFSGTPLSTYIPKTIDYHLQKLYEQEPSIVALNSKIIEDVYVKVKDGIIERYTSINAQPGVNYTFERIDYIIKRLKEDVALNRNSDYIQFEIFVNSLESHLNELFEMVREIDREFS